MEANEREWCVWAQMGEGCLAGRSPVSREGSVRSLLSPAGSV